MHASQVADQVRQFIVDEFLEGDGTDLALDSPLLEWGIIDSVGMVSLIAFLEQRFGLHIAQAEITPTNFHSLERISSMVVRDSSRPTAAAQADAESTEENDPELSELLEFGVQREWFGLASNARLHGLSLAGSQPTWLLLPEPGQSATVYGDILRALEGHHAAVAIDLPGFGLSTCADDEPSFWDHAAWLTELLWSGLAPRQVVVGHGLSAALALELASRLPERVAAVVALGFGALDDPRTLLGGGDDPRRFVAARRREAQALARSALARLGRRLAQPAFQAFLDAGAEAHLSELLGHSRVPTLFIGGLEDQLVSREAITRAAALGSHAEVKWLARVGHDFPIERADETVSLALGYLRNLTQGAST